jgi:phosphoglycolate phosphatase
MPSKWDQYDAYLFDIDGTLLHCTDAVHYLAFCDSLTTIAGRPLNLDGVVAHGNTDIGILRDALQLANIPDDHWRPGLDQTREAMGRFVEQRTEDLRMQVLPGVHEVLQHLHQQGALIGVATGNLETIGRAKLKHAGLLQYFDFEGYSDAHEYRRDVFRSALLQAKAIRGDAATVCVIGDTPEDVRSALANHLDVIAVATGIYPFEELTASTPTRCLNALTELLNPN